MTVAPIDRRNMYKVANHKMNSLSELDRLVISCVEPGGNWTSIPEDVPSKRLEQIREMARTRGMVRTSYYGRLRYDQPSYTISTLLNRPGNGTNIHPWEDRTISSREAARLQSFPDSFVFHGSEAAVRTQIGNAVPPLVGYAIGKSLLESSRDEVYFCDLFAGAGGLSYGLELAGLKGVAASELNSSAAKTYAENHSPETVMLEGDVRDMEIQRRLADLIKKKRCAGKLAFVGGPPCQGFSTAGHRNEKDKRNELVNVYLQMVKDMLPDYVVMENVHGILSMSKGEVVKNIYSSLANLGYTIAEKPWIVHAEEYGAPQMRKRVIVVAALNKKLMPKKPLPLFERCMGRREVPGSRGASMLPYPVTAGEALINIPPLCEVNHKYFPASASIDRSYSAWCRGEISLEEFFLRRTSDEASRAASQAFL